MHLQRFLRRKTRRLRFISHSFFSASSRLTWRHSTRDCEYASASDLRRSHFHPLLQALSQFAELKPVEAMSQAHWTDGVFLLRGKDDGVPAWHYILVPVEKRRDLKSHGAGSEIDCTDFGTRIQYRNKQNQTETLSGWGMSPPHHLVTWVKRHYSKILTRSSVNCNRQRGS